MERERAETCLSELVSSCLTLNVVQSGGHAPSVTNEARARVHRAAVAYLEAQAAWVAAGVK